MPSLDELLAYCLERYGADGAGGVESVCEAHPTHATELRATLEYLLEGGLLQKQEDQDTIGPYRLCGELGSGGMGVVYLASQSKPIRRVVALKVIKEGMDTRAVVARFNAERQALASLSHDGVARVFEAGATEQGRPYFAMEYVPGQPITTFCDKHRLEVNERLRLFVAVCDAVRHAHQHGIIHRDLKPSNIVVAGTREQPVAKIIDFGLAKAIGGRLTEDSFLTIPGRGPVGTWEYMSPEQADASLAVDTRTDVYSLGVILFELLTGELPLKVTELRERGAAEIVSAIQKQQPVRPSSKVSGLKGDLDAIILQALEKEPDRRYGSVAELADDVTNYLQSRPVKARRQTAWYLVSRFARRHRTAALVAALILVVLVGSAISILAFAIETQGLAIQSQERLDDFNMLGLVAGLRSLQQEELTNPPVARPGKDGQNIKAMQAWVEDVEKIFGLRKRMEAYLDEVSREVKRGEVRWSDWQTGDPARVELAKGIRETLARMDEMARPQGCLALMHPRIDWAQKVTDMTMRHPGWQAAIAAVKQDQRFRGLELKPQVGLVPIGPDPVSRLQEFAYLLPGGELPARDKGGHIKIGPATCPVFVLLPGGPFLAGSQKDDPKGPRYEKLRGPFDMDLMECSIDPFFASKFEFTHGQWKLLRNEEFFQLFEEPLLDLTHPVFAVWPDHLTHLLLAWGMRLPTAEEWEYLCRGGTDGSWWFGNTMDRMKTCANVADQTLKEAGGRPDSVFAPWSDGFPMTAPVGSLAPNPFGLFDVHGNVAELCVYKGDLVFRGGSWHQPPTSARCTYRTQWRRDPKPSIGFRPALSLLAEE